MRFRIPKIYDTIMDAIATVLFPSRKYTNVMLIGYTLAIGIGLSLWLDNWLWFVATVASMIVAAMLFEWML